LTDGQKERNMIVQFNWYELNNITRIPDCQVILIFCLYINKLNPEVKRISSSHHMLQKKLNISNNYYSLVHSKLILETRNGIFSNFKCAEPQSYITNCSFLHAKVSPFVKSEYLYILSQRSLGNKNCWVPENYVESDYWNNPFIKHNKPKLNFTLEKQL
jgi:hypothetical protein